MSVDTPVALLARIPIFSRLMPAQIAEIVRRAEKIKIPAREHITRAGTPGDGAFLLVSGNAEDLADPSQPLPPGSLIGELAMLVEHNYGATVVARERMHCLKITRAAMHSQILEDPSLGEHLTQHITQRLLRMANGLKHIDHDPEKSEAVSAKRSAFMIARPIMGALDRILRAQ